MYLSPIYPKEFIIDDNNHQSFAPARDVVINGELCCRGLELPEYKPRSAPFLTQWTKPTYPRSEWKERIEERARKRYILSEIVRKRKVPTSNQDSTNYCWTYGVVTAINCMRAWRNMPYVEFSRESVAAPLKNYRNNGGWGEQALQRIAEVGIMTQDLWPRYYYRNSQYNTTTNLEVAGNYKVEEFYVLPDRSFSHLISALLDDYAVAVGYNWWSHEVCAIDPIVLGSNSFGVRIWNSWGDSYGDGGMAVLTENRATPDDAVIPVVQIAS